MLYLIVITLHYMDDIQEKEESHHQPRIISSHKSHGDSSHSHLTLISRPGHNIGAPQYFPVQVSRKFVTNQSLLSLLAF